MSEDQFNILKAMVAHLAEHVTSELGAMNQKIYALTQEVAVMNKKIAAMDQKVGTMDQDISTLRREMREGFQAVHKRIDESEARTNLRLELIERRQEQFIARYSVQ